MAVGRRRSEVRAREIVVAADPAALAHMAADHFTRLAGESVARAGRFTLALAGGSTPERLYALLAVEPYRSCIPWGATHVFWGDERCVPPGHAESNYRMATKTLIRHVPIPREQIHRMRGENPDVDQASAEYERELREAFGLQAGGIPRFDLILLGMGRDGHAASLFPGSPALREVTRLVVAPYVDRLQTYRLTLTLPVLNAAREALFLVSGRDKALMLRSVLDGPRGTDPPPARLVSPRDGIVTWLIDLDAAHLLERSATRRDPG